MQKFTVASIAKGPLEQGGEYAKLWVIPHEWEDRASPHLTRGPVPFEMKTTPDVVDRLALISLPAVLELELVTRVASGNKATVSVKDFLEIKTDKPIK